MEDAICRFYTEEYDEAGRLTRTPHGRLEAARTRALLATALPHPPARILDVGGGPGHHAQWLVDEGYDVTLIDFVETHVRAALAKARRVLRSGGLLAAAAISRWAALIDIAATRLGR